LVTIWTALDDATPENGCLEIVPGSHRLGLLSWFGSTVSDENVARYARPEMVQPLPVPAGHAVLLHNWLLHRSGINPSSSPRRAFTCCYLDGRTRNNLTGELLHRVWGELPGETPAYLDQLRSENQQLRAARDSAVGYAESLQRENVRLQASMAEATHYAQTLEAEISKLQPARV
jgi:ectoine hydroxylase-related dioxygenase (phytanoyl-CoA dioxygenase family)